MFKKSWLPNLLAPAVAIGLASTACEKKQEEEKPRIEVLNQEEKKELIFTEEQKTVSLRMVQFMNELHGQDPARRFVEVDKLNSIGIYRVIVDGEAELYTTTFYGLVERLYKKMEAEKISGRELLERVEFKHFRNFLRLLVNYQQLENFLKTMTEREGSEIVERAVNEIPMAQDKVMEGALIAEMYGDCKNEELRKVISSLVRRNYEDAQKNNNLETQKIFGVLAGVIGSDMVESDPWFKKMSETFLDTEVARFEFKRFFTDGKDIQRYYFSNDETGKGSFASFLHQYKTNVNWELIRTQNYILIKSKKKGSVVEIYANLPEKSAEADEELNTLFRLNKIEPHIIIHRGHSYDVLKSLRGMSSNTSLVFLGSCGGYVNINTISRLSPAAEIIVTRGEGAKGINDALLFRINTELSRGAALDWEKIWVAARKMANDPRFDAYVRPDLNRTMLFIHSMRLQK